MKKITIFAIVLAFAFILFTTSSFATNNIMDNTENEVKNTAKGAGNVIENTVNGAGNVVSNIAGSVGSGISNIGNGIQNMTRGDMMVNDTNNNYTASRTAYTVNANSAGSFLGMGATAWGWLIMSIFGLAIVGLVWFYGKQHEDGYNPNHEDNY